MQQRFETAFHLNCSGERIDPAEQEKAQGHEGIEENRSGDKHQRDATQDGTPAAGSFTLMRLSHGRHVSEQEKRTSQLPCTSPSEAGLRLLPGVALLCFRTAVWILRKRRYI
jgi:hypothetical protein